MSFSRGVCVSLVVGLVQACGGSDPEAAPAGGGGPGSAGAGGMQAVGGGATAAAGSTSGNAGGSSLGPQMASDKLDVLFVVDNSLSMGGKQQVLANSLPRFVARLTNPLCVDAEGKPTAAQPTAPSAPCSSGSREFKPITDIHFGAITTSLGGHGGAVCAPQLNEDDQAQLLPSRRDGVVTYQNSGFLAFDATGQAGESDPALLSTSLSQMITAAGENGCGYEAPLEAMYRFLVDPEPPLSVQLVDQVSVPTGNNDVLLAQRKAFLRPDSSLAIVLFSDENDCSVLDTGIGWLVAAAMRSPRATSACDSNPNDPCCRSCASVEATPSGCTPVAQDSVCSVIPEGDTVARWTPQDDSLNLRCFDQQRRFGVDLLQPIERYTNGLSNPKVPNRAGTLVENPLFAARDGKGPRSPTLISLSVIVGAPWQDLATPASLDSPSLEYLNSAGLESNGRWPLLIGDKKKNVPPSDPFMIESIAPRTGQNPLTMMAIAPATSTNPQQSPINGHEMNNADQTDLQHACIFPLPTPVVCMPAMAGCDCAPSRSDDLSMVVQKNSALCQPPGGGPVASTQYYAKAYPGTRELTFARQMGARAAPASLCPKTLGEPSNPEYGYGPAFNALVGRIAQTLK